MHGKVEYHNHLLHCHSYRHFSNYVNLSYKCITMNIHKLFDLCSGNDHVALTIIMFPIVMFAIMEIIVFPLVIPVCNIRTCMKVAV